METGGPAFPREDYQANGHERGFEKLGQEGMSMRDYFAAKAMQGIISSDSNYGAFADLAEDAYAIADAMIEASSAHN